MSDEPAELVAATARSKLAREKLAGTLAEIQSRLNPKALARDALQEIRETGQEMAREGVAVAKRHPIGIAGAVAAVGLFAARGPIKALFSGRKADTETTTPDDAPEATKGTQQ